MNYKDGRLLITPECTSFEEIEGQINSLQDELRERAQRALQAARQNPGWQVTIEPNEEQAQE